MCVCFFLFISVARQRARVITWKDGRTPCGVPPSYGGRKNPAYLVSGFIALNAFRGSVYAFLLFDESGEHCMMMQLYESHIEISCLREHNV